MTYAPSALLAARAYLRQHTGLPDVSLGIVGGSGHTGGYHLGWDRLRQHFGSGDYSVRESPRDGQPTDGASALDIGDFPRLRELSAWIVKRCEAGHPSTADIREVIWSPDGRVVRRWDRLKIRSSGDSSHLTHTHISYHRDSETRDKTALFRAFFEPVPDKGDDMEPRDVWRGFTGLDYVNAKPSTKDNQLARAHEYSREGLRVVRRTDEKVDAILTAVTGGNAADVLARIDAHHAEQMAEFARIAARIEPLEEKLAEVRELVEEATSGERDAAAVVDEIHRRLGPANPGQV